MLSIIINVLDIKNVNLKNILKPLPGNNYQYIFITTDPILKKQITLRIDTSFNILHFTDTIISALGLLNENEEFIIHECKYVFHLYIDNFLWYTKINNYNIVRIIRKVEHPDSLENDVSYGQRDDSTYYVGFNYYKNLNKFIHKNQIENNEYDILNIYEMDYNDNIKINKVKKINCKAVYQPHWGWTDYVILISLIEHYKKQFQELYIVGFYAHKESLEHLYKDVNFYYIDIPLSTSLNEYLQRSDCKDISTNDSLLYLIPKLFNENYLFLMDSHQCSQDFPVHFNTLNLESNSIIQQLNKDQLKNTTSFFKNEMINPSNINLIDKIKILSLNSNIFDERVLFYTLAHIDESMIINQFNIYRIEEEDLRYNEIIQTIGYDYIVVHYLETMNIKNTKNYPIYLLNEKSNKIMDLLKIIENAKEIHIYDSLYGTLIYLLYFSLHFCKNIPIYFHKYARQKIANFYNYDLIEKSNDWHILLD